MVFFPLPVEYVDRREISYAVVSALLEMLFWSVYACIHVEINPRGLVRVG